MVHGPSRPGRSYQELDGSEEGDADGSCDGACGAGWFSDVVVRTPGCRVEEGCSSGKENGAIGFRCQEGGREEIEQSPGEEKIKGPSPTNTIR